MNEPIADQAAARPTNANGAIRPHPDNPRYFLYQGRKAVLITTTEHYGAVSNTAFDYEAYLDMLHRYGFNLTRIVVLLREAESEFKGYLGRQNTLAPRAGDYEGPWARSGVPGCLDGGRKFDLDVWNETYFARLRDFCAKAGERGIIVECTLFSQMYSGKADSPWSLNPLHPANHVNAAADGARYNRFTALSSPELTARQEALVRKVAAELAAADNVYYEICNEPPYPQEGEEDGLPKDHPAAAGERAISEWQNRMAAVLADEEAKLGCRHMIAACDPHPHLAFDLFSLYNFHYREWAEKGLSAYWDHGKPIGFDETLTGIVSWNQEMDFRGRRQEAWEFMLRGCAVYDYLDFTIATDDPLGEGNAPFPGGDTFDGTSMRMDLMHLKAFMDGIDFVRMQPDPSFAKPGNGTARAFALADEGRSYAVYMAGSAVKSLSVKLPPGRYRAEWFDPLTGAVVRTAGGIAADGTGTKLSVPPYREELALTLTAEAEA